MTIAPTPCFSAHAGVNTHPLTLLCYHLPFRRKFALSPNGSGSPLAAAAAVVVLGPVGTQCEYQILWFNLFVIIVVFLVKGLLLCLCRSLK